MTFLTCALVTVCQNLIFLYAADTNVREGCWVPHEGALPMRLHLPVHGGNMKGNPGVDVYPTGSALMQWQPDLHSDRG